ncbi:hypothetical protein G9A89_001587 [Geosiphon pyriformis]|nr:hypothetical protein G9A89_001587 [Geosiphon pyriformis]
MNTPKDMIVAALAEFGEIKSIKIQLIKLWQKASFLIDKNLVHVAMTVGDHETWVSRDRFKALLFTLPMGTTAHNLGTLLDRTGRKICVINHSIDSNNWVYCAVIDFESDENLKSAYHTEPIFNGVKLFWARLDLVCCEKYKHFGHSALECDTLTPSISKSSRLVKRVFLEGHCLRLAKLYARKDVLISKTAAFDGKSWVQVVSLAFSSSGSHFDSGFESGPLPSGFLSIKKISDIVCRLNDIELVPLVPVTQVVLLATAVLTLCLSLPLFSLILENKVVDLGLSSSKVLISKVGGLESKRLAFKVSIGSILEKLDLLCLNSGSLMHSLPWIMNKFNGPRIFTSGLNVGFHGAGVAIIMNNSLAWHVLKIDEIPSHLISFSQAANINSMVFRAVNFSSFVVLGGNFNKNGSSKSDADDVQWLNFKDCSSAKLLAKSDMFEEARVNDNLNTMWKILEKAMVQTVDTVFSRIWFSKYDCLRNKQSSKFFKLELLVAKIVKYWNSGDLLNFNCLIKIWLAINVVKASKVDDMVLNDISSMKLIKHLLGIRKEYYKSKYYESKVAKNTAIRKTIDYYMENFCSDKEKMIKSILERLFCKVVLDYLVVDNELVIESNEIKLKIDRIMER